MASTWGAFLGWVVASCGAVLAAAFTAVLIIDPYGYLGLRGNHEVEILPERLITAVRASDQSFDSAIIGNSVSVPLLPADLSRLTGAKFVSLSLSGSGPKAQIAVLDFFFRRHRSVRNIVIGMDDSWCYASPSTFREWRPFPFWLYGGLAGYMAGLARNTSMALLLSPFEPRDAPEWPPAGRRVSPPARRP